VSRGHLYICGYCRVFYLPPPLLQRPATPIPAIPSAMRAAAIIPPSPRSMPAMSAALKRSLALRSGHQQQATKYSQLWWAACCMPVAAQQDHCPGCGDGARKKKWELTCLSWPQKVRAPGFYPRGESWVERRPSKAALFGDSLQTSSYSLDPTTGKTRSRPLARAAALISTTICAVRLPKIMSAWAARWMFGTSCSSPAAKVGEQTPALARRTSVPGDVHTGKLGLDPFTPIPHPGELNAETWATDAWKKRRAAPMPGPVWCWMTSAASCSQAPVSASDDFYGGERPGQKISTPTACWRSTPKTGKLLVVFPGGASR